MQAELGNDLDAGFPWNNAEQNFRSLIDFCVRRSQSTPLRFWNQCVKKISLERSENVLVLFYETKHIEKTKNKMHKKDKDYGEHSKLLLEELCRLLFALCQRMPRDINF